MTAFNARNISFSHREKAVIDDITLDFPEGVFHGILGPNGCGKTTLLDLLVRHAVPARGSIRFLGKELHSFSRKALSRRIALVSQDYYINFPYTVKEVVMMGRFPHIGRFARPSAEDMETVDRVMAETGITKFAERRVTELSGGERQRVVFARALAQDTEVLILDEATSNLDINHALTLLSIAAESVEKKGKTVISVFQDINLAALYCGNMIFMKEGRVAASGPTDAVLSEETLKKVFNVSAHVAFDSYADARKVVFRKKEAIS